MENLLSKIIKEEKIEELARLDSINIVESLFSELLDREKDILTRRFGLGGEKGETLEKIGNLHKLTRERVRQIEAASIKKIKKLEILEASMSTLREAIHHLLDEHGGLIKRNYLLDILTVLVLELNNNISHDDSNYETSRLKYRNHFNFLISKLLSDDLDFVDSHDQFTSSIKAKDNVVSHLEELATDLMSSVSGLKKTMSTEELLELLKKSDVYGKHQEKLTYPDSADISKVFKSKIFPDKAETINSDKVLYSLMQSIKDLEQNKYGDWGMSDWQEVKPKTVNDKIYLVLKHQGDPLHFTEIANKINEMKFDKKKANAATVHNELILDDRYILVNRGTYGLKEWQK